MAPLWPLTFSSGERPRALWALLFDNSFRKYDYDFAHVGSSFFCSNNILCVLRVFLLIKNEINYIIKACLSIVLKTQRVKPGIRGHFFMSKPCKFRLSMNLTDVLKSTIIFIYQQLLWRDLENVDKKSTNKNNILFFSPVKYKSEDTRIWHDRQRHYAS